MVDDTENAAIEEQLDNYLQQRNLLIITEEKYNELKEYEWMYKDLCK